MDYKKQYFSTKYEKLKADEPGMIISKGSVALFRMLSILFIWVSAIGIISSLTVISVWYHDTHSLIGSAKAILCIFLLVVLVLLLVSSITIYVFGNKISRRNTYIQELDRLAGDMINENVGGR